MHGRTAYLACKDSSVAAGGGCVSMREAGLSWGQNGSDVHPRQAWFRALACFVIQDLVRLPPLAEYALRVISLVVISQMCQTLVGIRHQ